MHQLMAATLDTVIEEIHAIQHEARIKKSSSLPVWPMVVLRTPKGWTGPKFVDGKPVEGTWRAHQVPVADLDTKPEHLAILEDWRRVIARKSCSTMTVSQRRTFAARS
jgi:xylulose-5-phosphate/fructose-6-phosphate phosphoketolase